MKAIDRVLKIIKESKLNNSSFERAVGLSNGYLAKQKNRNADLGEGILLKILEYCPNINPSWLLTGRGVMKIEKNNLATEEEIDYEIFKKKGVPYFDIDFTASFLDVENNQQSKPDQYVSHPFFSGCDFIVRASGQSMAKVIKHGDMIGLIQIETWREFIPMGEIYAIVTDNGFRMIKIITMGADKEHFTLISKPTDSKKDEFPDQEISKKNILSIFKVQASSHLF